MIMLECLNENKKKAVINRQNIYASSIISEKIVNSMDKIQWAKERQDGIYGSDVGALLGVNKNITAFQVYLDKTAEITETTQISEAEYWEDVHTESITKEFTKRTGKKVRKYSKYLMHKDYPFMIADIDRKIIGENSILKCRAVSYLEAKKWLNGEIPDNHILQYQHYLAITRAEKCYAAYLVDGQRFFIKEFIRDEELIEMIIDEENKFWNKLVMKRFGGCHE